MDSKETAFLKILADLSFPEKQIVINPNDGFDLGLMMTDATVTIHYDTSPANFTGSATGHQSVFGNVYQKNECKVGTVELSAKAVERMGSPKAVRLHLLPGDTYPHILIEKQ